MTTLEEKFACTPIAESNEAMRATAANDLNDDFIFAIDTDGLKIVKAMAIDGPRMRAMRYNT